MKIHNIAPYLLSCGLMQQVKTSVSQRRAVELPALHKAQLLRTCLQNAFRTAPSFLSLRAMKSVWGISSNGTPKNAAMQPKHPVRCKNRQPWRMAAF